MTEPEYMFPFSAVAALIEAAGGEIVVPERLLLDPPGEIARFDDPVTGAVRFTTRRRTVVDGAVVEGVVVTAGPALPSS